MEQWASLHYSKTIFWMIKMIAPHPYKQLLHCLPGTDNSDVSLFFIGFFSKDRRSYQSTKKRPLSGSFLFSELEIASTSVESASATSATATTVTTAETTTATTTRFSISHWSGFVDH